MFTGQSSQYLPFELAEHWQLPQLQTPLPEHTSPPPVYHRKMIQQWFHGIVYYVFNLPMGMQVSLVVLQLQSLPCHPA